MAEQNGHREQSGGTQGKGTWKLKTGLAQMLKGGVIMDVVNAEQASIAEEAGAVAVMALERVPADIRAQGGVARMSDPELIVRIKEAVTIPVMAKCRIGHFVEAQILQALGVDYIDESEVLTPADEEHHIDKHAFKVPFVCGARDLGEALRRIGEGAAMIRTKGEAGTGNIVEAVRHMRAMIGRHPPPHRHSAQEELMAEAKRPGRAAMSWCAQVHETGTSAGGELRRRRHRHPGRRGADDAAGRRGVFVGSGIFKSGDPARAPAIVQATTHYQDPARSSPRSRAASASRCAAWKSAPSGARICWPRAGSSGMGVHHTGIGVLALQGGVAEHGHAARAGCGSR